MHRLFIMDNCESCITVMVYIKKHNLDCKVIDVSKERNNGIKKAGMIFPALFIENELIAYGSDDILKYFTNYDKVSAA